MTCVKGRPQYIVGLVLWAEFWPAGAFHPMNSMSSNKSDSSRSRVVEAKRLPRASAVKARRLFEAERQASEIIEEARARTQTLLEEAKSRRDELVKQGFDQGRKDGIASVTEELARVLSEVAEIRGSASERLVQLATKIAHKVLKEAVSLNPDVVVSMARRALEEVRWCREITLRINPEDLEIIRKQRQKLTALLDSVNELRLEGDPQVERGGCLVESEAGILDATLSTQLAALERALIEDAANTDDR